VGGDGVEGGVLGCEEGRGFGGASGTGRVGERAELALGEGNEHIGKHLVTTVVDLWQREREERNMKGHDARDGSQSCHPKFWRGRLVGFPARRATGA